MSTTTILFTKLASAVRATLTETPEYEVARSEGRAREWLDRESASLAYALADVVAARLDDLDA